MGQILLLKIFILPKKHLFLINLKRILAIFQRREKVNANVYTKVFFCLALDLHKDGY